MTPHKFNFTAFFEPVDISSLIYFRLVYGLVMIGTFVSLLVRIDIKANWIDPPFHFHYIGFEWVNPLPDPYLHLFFALLALLAFFITIGYRYIISCCFFFIGLTYFLLINQLVGDNYYYLACLISLILIFVPAQKKFSYDAWRDPSHSPETTPAWTVWILRFQIAMPYVFGGIAKLYGDWLEGFVTKGLFASSTDLPFVGQFCQEPWFIYGTTYGGIFFDLLIVPLLIFRPFRKLGLILLFSFHIFNYFAIKVGLFAVFTFVTTLIMLPPSWPRVLVDKFRKKPFENVDRPEWPPCNKQRLTISLIGIYVVIQLLIPLRHHLIKGNVHWTEEGVVFSWAMRSSIKKYRLDFYLYDEEQNKRALINKRDLFTPAQVAAMATDPDKILQAAHYIAAKYVEMPNAEQVGVRVRSRVRLNGRESQFLIDPEIDLLTKSRTFKHKDWIMPLIEPLPVSLFDEGK